VADTYFCLFLLAETDFCGGRHQRKGLIKIKKKLHIFIRFRYRGSEDQEEVYLCSTGRFQQEFYGYSCIFPRKRSSSTRYIAALRKKKKKEKKEKALQRKDLTPKKSH